MATLVRIVSHWMRLLFVWYFLWTVILQEQFCRNGNRCGYSVVSSFVQVAQLFHHRTSPKNYSGNDSLAPPMVAQDTSQDNSSDTVLKSTTTRPPKHIAMPVSKKSWQVWKTIHQLETIQKDYKDSDNQVFPLHPATPKLVAEIIGILQQLATQHEGKKEWQGLLNKSTLLHEVEESILAIHFLETEWKVSNHPKILVDVCCGKGVFSLLASYYFDSSQQIQKIIMLDKDPKLQWDHIAASNSCNHDGPYIETWPRFNLHQVDEVVNRLLAEIDSSSAATTTTTLTLVGIHLCKTLSPTCIGIVNMLGPEACPQLVLAPCCLPRVVVQSKTNALLEIRQHETKQQRKNRLLAKERRDRAMVRGKTNVCWKCGEVGHQKADCPSNQSTGKPQLIQPPSLSLQVSGILATDRPFGTYCDLLSTSIQRRRVSVEETGLANSHATANPKQNKQEANNWNRDRKSVYIVASERLAETDG